MDTSQTVKARENCGRGSALPIGKVFELEESKSGERDDCGLWRIGDGRTSLSVSPSTWFLPALAL